MLIRLDNILAIVEQHLRWEVNQGLWRNRSDIFIYEEMVKLADHKAPPTRLNAHDALVTLWCRAQLGA